MNSWTRPRWLVLILVWVLSVGYMATRLKRGWVPSDEGYFGQTAERVLHGELPHRDFDEGYTGALTFLNAFAFRELGINSASLRIVLFAFFIAWVPAVFCVASRFLSNYASGAVTLLAVVWSVPNYPAPMPSWYNLFFATFGLSALFRYLEVGSPRWLFVAGLCGGISITAKTTGLYFVAGVLLFFIFREQGIASDPQRDDVEHSRIYSATLVLGLAIFLFLLFNLLHRVPLYRELTYFFLPAFAVVVLLLTRELSGIPGPNAERYESLLRMCVPFGSGVALPVVVFLVPFMLSGSVHAVLHNVFGVPVKMFHFAMVPTFNSIELISTIPIMLLVILALESGRIGRFIYGSVLSVYLGIILVASANSDFAYGLGWRSVATSIPVLVLASVMFLGFSRTGQQLSFLRQQQLMLLVSVTALTSVVQFPFSVAIYFCYIAPLVILTAAALLASAASPPRFVLAATAIFCLLFAVLRVYPPSVYWMGIRYLPDAQTERLTLPRTGGLRVDPESARMYESLIPFIQAHASGNFIYATPDCPEIYFLSGFENPTRALSDFTDDPAGRTDRTLRMLQSQRINVVAINDKPTFSGLIDPVLHRALEQQYAHAAQFGSFEVRWNQ